MANRIWWFLGFYCLLSLFVIYELIYVIVIWTNKELINLYASGFTFKVSGTSSFNPSSFLQMFIFPLLGLFLSVVGITIGITTQLVVLKTTTANRKGFFLVTSFIIFLSGFYFSFAGQLFYNQWSDSNVLITHNDTGVSEPAINFYQHWLSLTMIWTTFGMFFGMAIVAIILIVKLYFLNIQWTRYILRNDQQDDGELELLAPLPSNKEFNPNETQTITITLDKQTFDEQDNLSSKKKTGSFLFNKLDIKRKKHHKGKKKILDKKKK